MDRTRTLLDASRPLLWSLALLGGGVLNSVYLYYAVTAPDLMRAALANPISAVFMAEAFALLGLGAWLVARAGLTRPGWVAFVGMAIAGSLAFAVPVFILLHLRSADRPADTR